MDRICIQKVLNGDQEAFRQLITRYKDMAYSIAMSVVKDEFYAEEVLQVSFMKAYDKLSTFNGNSRFSTWFYRIVINESFKQIKKNKTGFVDFVENLPEFSNEPDPSILKLEEEEQKHYINMALRKLSSKESLVLRLYYLEEYSIEEICDITGWSVSNTKVILHRARLSLRLILTEFFKFDKKVLY